MKAVGLLAIVAAAAAVFAGTSATASTACRLSNRTTWATNYSQPGGAGANCAYGTTLTFKNQSFVCNKPLSQYGTLPLRVIVNEAAPGGWGKTNAGKIILSDNWAQVDDARFVLARAYKRAPRGGGRNNSR